MPGAENGARGAVLTGLTAFGVAWALGLLMAPPVPIYDPATGDWHWGRVPTPQEMVWYGHFLWAWVVALPVAGLGAFAGRRGVPFGDRWLAWALTALGAAVVLSVLAFWP